jgi:Putative AphA-like transcriptional regulator
MEEIRRMTAPLDAVSVGILVVTGFSPLPVDGILRALSHIGAPSWRPVGEVVTTAIERLLDRNWLVIAPSMNEAEVALTPSEAARGRLPDLLAALPLSASAPDIAYKLKIIGLDLLDRHARRRQIEELAGHWRGVLAQWQDAARNCPCVQHSARQWMAHSAMLARSEVEWLTSIAGESGGASAAPPPPRA